MAKIVGLFFIFFLLTECSFQNESGIPEHIQRLENLTIFPTDNEPEVRISFERKKSFGDGNDIFIGNLGSIAVDNEDKVFIGDSAQQIIHIFDSDGKYLTNIGRKGAGPGEFGIINALSVNKNMLYVYDGMYYQIQFFSLNSYELLRTVNVSPANQAAYKELEGLTLGSFYFKKDDTYIVGFKPPIHTNPDDERYNINEFNTLYYILDKSGRIISGNIFELKGYRYLTAFVNDEFRFSAFEFLGESLVAVSDNDYIYTAESTDFLVQVFSPDGQYVRSFYYPVNKHRFNKEDAIEAEKQQYEAGVTDWRTSIIEHAPAEKLPQTWPVINDLLIDDKNRLWISTIVNDEEKYEWWILNNKGKLLSVFDWLAEEPIEEIKNGYMYTRKTHADTGLQKIVKYKIIWNQYNNDI